MRNYLGILTVCVGLSTSGCILYTHPIYGHEPPGRAKKVIHIHGPTCGHSWVDGAWIGISAGHVHGKGCGHFLWSGYWYGTRVKVKVGG